MPEADAALGEQSKIVNIRSLLLVAVFFGSMALVYHPWLFDYRVETFVTGIARGNLVLRSLAYDLASYGSVSGLVSITAIWYCWTGSTFDRKSRLLVGSIAAFLASVLSWVIQHLMISHRRWLQDPAFGVPVPTASDPQILPVWNSFPSDHAALFFGLAAVVISARSRLGLFVFMWAVIVNLSRIYLAYHYPSDIAGGAAWGMLVVWASQSRRPLSWARALIGWGERHARLAVPAVFVIAYQLANLCDEARHIVNGLMQAIAGKLP